MVSSCASTCVSGTVVWCVLFFFYFSCFFFVFLGLVSHSQCIGMGPTDVSGVVSGFVRNEPSLAFGATPFFPVLHPWGVSMEKVKRR